MPSAAKFWSRVDVRGADECWTWRGCRNAQGYGHLCPKTWGTSKAHRMAFELSKGVSPGNLNVCHSCDNPSCCNPAHLWLGTQSDNIKDALRKGRLTPPILPPGSAARGEKAALAVLTESQAREIGASTERTEELVRRYGVSFSTIWQVRAGRTWTHVTGITRRSAQHVARVTDLAVEVNGQVYRTQAAAARALGVSPFTVAAWIASGKLRRPAPDAIAA